VAIGKQAFYTQIDLDQPKAYSYAKEVMSMNLMAGRRAGGDHGVSRKAGALLEGEIRKLSAISFQHHDAPEARRNEPLTAPGARRGFAENKRFVRAVSGEHHDAPEARCNETLTAREAARIC